MTDDDKARVAERWSDISSGSDEFSSNVYWLAVPAVMARHQRRACAGGNYGSWVEYCLGSFAPQGHDLRMLSIGCGYGDLERHLMRIDASIMCDAFDIAPAAIEGAIRAATEEGFAGIHYRCADIETAGLEQGVYDAAWFNGSLHHIQALERVLERVHNSLKPGGLLFVNEYVGANHFGFPPAQREAISHAFHLIPHQYRRSFIPASLGQVATQAPIPDPAEVRRVDPSEAIRSQDIVPAIADNFDILAINACGGTILQFLLSGIAGNFREDDASSMLVLDMLFKIEDALMAAGTIGSDFVVIAARKRAKLKAEPCSTTG
ncbi:MULTISPECIES: class I SAM-dependent methyltransferase [unclassified Mesorhizobium]|uniref:class I SAM-dependent methyltransferase n=1 Tax=Mesorhizobium sp. LNJC398B00 TaxID=1287276 RepID=UPI0004CDEAAA|nr:class I SAM-dependent methyltransferase [Mesorhizobium sp. LNJC398B00]